MFLLFLGLQLTGHINWPWYAVAAPLWVPLAIVVAVLIIAGMVLGVSALFELRRKHRQTPEQREFARKVQEWARRR